MEETFHQHQFITAHPQLLKGLDVVGCLEMSWNPVCIRFCMRHTTMSNPEWALFKWTKRISCWTPLSGEVLLPLMPQTLRTFHKHPKGHACDWEYFADSSMVWIYEWCTQLQHFEWNLLLHVAQQKVFVTRRHRDSVRILLVEWRILVQCHVFEFNSHITVFNAKRLDSIMFHHFSIFFYHACFMVSWFLGSRRAEVILLFLYLLLLVSTILIRRLLDAEDVLWVFWWCHLVLWFFYPAGPHFGVASAFGLKFQHCRSVHFVILVGSVDVRRVYLQLEKG